MGAMEMKRILSIIILTMLLAGCVHDPVKPEIVYVPVAVGCLGKKPARPVPKFGIGEYPGDKVAAQRALSDASEWEGYAVGLEATMAGCTEKKDEKNG